MSNFLKRTKRALEEIAYDEIHTKAKEQHYYPGISYQRLFDVISEAGPTPTISQMTDIIHVVKTDFIDDKKEAGKMYSGKEVAEMMKSSFKAGRKDFMSVLDENLQAQISGYYNVDKTDAEKEKRNAVIEEYKDLIAILKSKNAE